MLFRSDLGRELQFRALRSLELALEGRGIKGKVGPAQPDPRMGDGFSSAKIDALGEDAAASRNWCVWKQLDPFARVRSIRRMKFLSATIAYLAIGVVLGWGILLATHGNLWLLAISGLAYVLVFAFHGCRS